MPAWYLPDTCWHNYQYSFNNYLLLFITYPNIFPKSAKTSFNFLLQPYYVHFQFGIFHVAYLIRVWIDMKGRLRTNVWVSEHVVTIANNVFMHFEFVAFEIRFTTSKTPVFKRRLKRYANANSFPAYDDWRILDKRLRNKIVFFF